MGLFKEIASVIKLDSRYEVEGVRVRGRKGGGGRERRPEEESFLLKRIRIKEKENHRKGKNVQKNTLPLFSIYTWY